ncbi:unnamed protein product [Prunus armeniaca]
MSSSFSLNVGNKSSSSFSKNSSMDVIASVDSNGVSLSCLSVYCDGSSGDDVNAYLGKYRSSGGRRYLTSDWESYISHEGQKFEGAVCKFCEKLLKYSMEIGFKLKYLKNEPSCLSA